MRSLRGFGLQLALGSAMLPVVFTGTPGVPNAPTPGDATRAGWITAKVDAGACSQPDPACEGFPPGPAVAGNANPVRLVVQLETMRASDALTQDAFDVRTQASPPDAAPAALASCAACFAAKPGGTYDLWLVPPDGPWKAGSYFLRVGISSIPGLAPALVRLEIPGAAPRPLNHPPVPSIVASPPLEQSSSRAVIFDGSASADPDPGDFITMYRWMVTSTNPDAGKPNPIIFEGPGVSSISFPSDTLGAFVNAQDLLVTLSITEDPLAPAQSGAGLPIAYRAQQVISYSIVSVSCNANTAPTAVLSGPPTQNVFGFPQSVVSFVLDGSLSSDPETPIDIYNFSCGNGSVPTPTGSPSKVTCRYVVDVIPRTYTATLAVVDRGTGQIVNGTYQCQKQSALTSIQVVVAPLGQ